MVSRLLNAGLAVPSQNEIKTNIDNAVTGVLGPVNTSPDSITGQINGVMSERDAILWETIQHVDDQRFLSKASGDGLDALGDWLGVPRGSATETQVNAVIYGDESSSVPIGSLAGAGAISYQLESTSTISRAALLDGTLSVTYVNGAIYLLRINATDYTYTALSTDNAISVASSLATIASTNAAMDVSASGSAIRLTSKNRISGYPVSFAGNMEWSLIGSPAVFIATEKGPNILPVNALNRPITGIVGWTGVNNLIAGATGTSRETDISYRYRLYQSRTSSMGAATEPAIRSRLLNEVSGVTLALVLENDTLQTLPGGQPPKSINCVVAGGFDQDIADAIAKYKGAGIEAWGGVNVTTTSSSGQPMNIGFSRTSEHSIYVKIDVLELDLEERLPADVIASIKAGVMNYAATLLVGSDVITQRILGYIYSATSGIGRMNITVSTDGLIYTDENITIPASSVAIFDTTRIEVTGV